MNWQTQFRESKTHTIVLYSRHNECWLGKHSSVDVCHGFRNLVSVLELRESVSELRESVSEVKDSVEGLQLTAQALLQIAAQPQRENEARRAEIAEIRQRQEESDKPFEVLLSEVRYLIRQIKPENQS
ncbi:MAG: hypothetical protein O9324_24510 [Microcystis sp. LE19-84.1B]|jgi:hypothetical protein|uniref:hypothetical protein n=1 Tax=Microcystis sp. LE19-84.1B TaxID=3016438 RepID=UPI0022CAD33C|nr:hypothetical protein [Microcystis sp. LE19-84.1B]MCZ8227014.1 hypothetical protein [Microcystis sp. LE19-84.1B]